MKTITIPWQGPGHTELVRQRYPAPDGFRVGDVRTVGLNIVVQLLTDQEYESHPKSRAETRIRMLEQRIMRLEQIVGESGFHDYDD